MLLLAVPLVGLLMVTGYGVYSGITQARDAGALQRDTDLALTAYTLIGDLQIERSALVDGTPTPPETQAAVQASAESLARQAADIGGPIGAEAERALVRVDAAQRVDAIGLGARAALTSHSAAIDRLLDLATMATDPGGAIDGAPAATANNLARAQAASAQERDLVVVVAEEGELTASSFQQLTSLASAQRSYAALAASTAPPAMAVQIERVGHGINAADAVRRDVFSDAGVRDYSVWISGLETRTADLTALQGDASLVAVQAVDDLATSSRLLLVLAALAAVATLLITALLLRRAIGSIARPLEELAAQAEDVARTRLPDAVRAQQIDPGSGVQLPALRASGAAEVHEVADAFNDIQDTALRLASEQAALRVNQAEALTNLGRRNQTLLARQLDFISTLETKETDPEFLEHLFKLDHLASRMRRNAESLLILAGSETPRRRRAPAEVSEVVRAAMSEVEEFSRVRIGHLRDATLTGPVVIDLIHLLAEIIENALGFSPPDTTVEIDGRSLGQGGYQFAVIDHGVGMSDVELVAANQRLAGLDELEGMPTRYLGQYVVAKLAAKTGVMVRLQPSSGGRGVTALVILPATAVLGGPDRSTITSPLPGSRAAREQGPVPFAPGVGVQGVSVAPGGPDVIEASVVPDLRDRRDDTSDVASGGRFGEPFTADPLAADPFATELGTTDLGASDAGAAPHRPEPWVPTGDAAGTGPGLFAPEAATSSATSSATPSPEPATSWPASDPWASATPAADLTTPQGSTTDGATGNGAAAPDASGHDDFGIIFETAAPGRAADDPTADPIVEPAAAVDPLDAVAEVFDPSRESADDAWWTAPTPPPAPDAVPEQPSWQPLAEAGPAAADRASSHGSGRDGTTSDGANPDGAPGPWSGFVDDEPQPFEQAPLHSLPPLAPSASVGATSGPKPSGGLARRVPGASLADSRRPGPADGPRALPDRSADGVRSMLSSFQAGRTRGRVRDGDAEATTSAPADGVDVHRDATDPASDSSQDGRSTR